MMLSLALLATLFTLPEILGLEKTLVELGKNRPEAVKVTGPIAFCEKGLGVAKGEGKSTIIIPRLPAGVAWRPSSSVIVLVRPQGLRDGVSLRVRSRGSLDAVHWTDWKMHEKEAKRSHEPLAGTLEGTGMERYADLMSAEWAKSDPPWSSDEDAYVRWLAQKHPEMFEKTIPRIGWVELEIDVEWKEALEKGTNLLTTLDVEIHWFVGGLHSRPKDGSEPNYDTKWHFIAETKVEKREGK